MTIKRLSTLLLAIFLVLILPSCDTMSPPAEEEEEEQHKTPDAIDNAITAVNTQAATLGVKALTRTFFNDWFSEFQQYNLLPEERRIYVAAIEDGKLPAGVSFAAVNNSADNLPNAIVFNPANLSLVEEQNEIGYLDYMQGLFDDSGSPASLLDEPFLGTLQASNFAPLNVNVPIRVTEFDVAGTALVDGFEERAALKVEVEASLGNIDEIARYFSIGQDLTAVKAILATKLGSEGAVWVNLADIMPGWVKNKVNTFPVNGDNEVCHGAAREFYYNAQDATLNASTEAVILMMDKHYKALTADQTPVFGDYMYVPGRHSGRYIVKDPNSGRDISFAVQSGGVSTYRFFWIDEDFSGDPFAGKPNSKVFEDIVDVYRCVN